MFACGALLYSNQYRQTPRRNIFPVNVVYSNVIYRVFTKAGPLLMCITYLLIYATDIVVCAVRDHVSVEGCEVTKSNVMKYT